MMAKRTKPKRKPKEEPYRGDPADTIGPDLFEVVCKFFERQRDGPIVDWFAEAPHRKVYRTMEAAYQWWRVDRPALEKEQLAQCRDSDVKFVKCKDRSGSMMVFNQSKEAKARSERYWEIDKQLHDTDTKHLIAIIKVRGGIWD
jgi:hypothetical protein